MKTKILGKTGIEISPIGFGTLTLGPFQLNMSVKEGGAVIKKALARGINLIDTARAYNTYPYVREALKDLPPGDNEKIHIISRSYDYTYAGMKDSFREALSEMNLERISIFMLHEAESEGTIQGHADALKYLTDMKKAGKLTATGISTHHIAAVESAADHPDIDVIFAILNREGLGILDGNARQMENALKKAWQAGKGILLMKALGGGHLFKQAAEALKYARNLPFVHSVILGMQDEEEINYNISIFEEIGEKPQKRDIPEFLQRKNERSLFIEPWCCGCGECVKACPFGALYIEEGRVKIQKEKCLLCSYCARHCPYFNIKII